MARKEMSLPRTARGQAEQRSIESPARMVEEAFASARTSVDNCLNDLTEYTQRNPTQALLSALATGYVLRVLPTTRLLAGIIRLALLLLKPAAFIYGIAKLWQSTQRPAMPHSTQEVS